MNVCFTRNMWFVRHVKADYIANNVNIFLLGFFLYLFFFILTENENIKRKRFCSFNIYIAIPLSISNLKILVNISTCTVIFAACLFLPIIMLLKNNALPSLGQSEKNHRIQNKDKNRNSFNPSPHLALICLLIFWHRYPE